MDLSWDYNLGLQSNSMLEHEFDSFKTQMQDTIQNKDSRISELQQALFDSLCEATKLKQEKLDIQIECNNILQKKQAVIDELQLNQRALQEKIDKCQGCARFSKELKDIERKFQETLQEKNRYIKESKESFKTLLRCKAEGDKSRKKALKELEDKLNCKHKNDMESLRSSFRMAVSTTSIERTSSSEPPMDAEVFAEMEDLKKDMTESCRKLKEEKERELEKLKRDMIEQQKQAQMKQEEEHKKMIALLQLEHEQALEKLKFRITAESQVSFNEAINSVAKEKDNIIECLRAKITTLDTELYNIRSDLQKYPPSRESISQSHANSIWSQSQQPSQSCSESLENRHKQQELSPVSPLQQQEEAPPVSAPTAQLQPLCASAPQPHFAYEDINVLNIDQINQHLVVNAALPLFETHVQLKQCVGLAVEQAVQEWLTLNMERYVNLSLTTCEQIIKKDFALDPEESPMRISAHHMIQSLIAGIVMISCRDPIKKTLFLSIVTNLRSAFLTALKDPTQQQKEMTEHASEVVATENLELACCFIQKTAVEKALQEIDKCLSNEYDARKHARNEGRRYYDPVALAYQAERMPEQIRLKVGGVSSSQMSVYKEFERMILGFLPTGEQPPPLNRPVAKENRYRVNLAESK